MLYNVYWYLRGQQDQLDSIQCYDGAQTLTADTSLSPHMTQQRDKWQYCYRDNLAKNVQVSPPQPGLERQQAATPKCHWIISYIGLIVRTSIVDLRADTGQIYRNWNVSPRAFLHYFNENFNYFTQLPLKMNKKCMQTIRHMSPSVIRHITA